MRSWRIAAVLVSVLVTGSSGFAQKGEPLAVVTTEMEPFFYLELGEPAGIEFEILTFYAKAQGRKLEVRWVASFKDVLPALARGNADIAAAAITVTEDRDRRFDFAAPHFPSQLRLVERAEHRTRTLSELDGTRVGVLSGSTGAGVLESIGGVEVRLANDVEALYLALSQGELRAIVSETARGLSLLESFPGLHFGPALAPPEHFAFALPEGSPLTESLSEHVTEIKASGIYFALLEKYMGSEAVEVVQLAQP